MSYTPIQRPPLKRGPKPHSLIEDAPVQTDDPPEFESHVVLRVPDDCVGRIQNIIAAEGKVEEFSINLNSDARNATVRIGNQLLNGKVLDLPTITEVHKTMDKKNLYKVANVSQMIVCTHDSINAVSSAPTISTEGDGPEAAAKAAKKAAKQWQYPHGMTPPMKSARKKRFRKTKKKKFMDAPEVEKELKRLLREDLAADSVTWEIVDASQDGGVADESISSRSQRHVTYPSSSEEDSDVGDEERDE